MIKSSLLCTILILLFSGFAQSRPRCAEIFTGEYLSERQFWQEYILEMGEKDVPIEIIIEEQRRKREEQQRRDEEDRRLPLHREDQDYWERPSQEKPQERPQEIDRSRDNEVDFEIKKPNEFDW